MLIVFKWNHTLNILYIMTLVLVATVLITIEMHCSIVTIKSGMILQSIL